ncbi:MAG: hydrogenase [Hyphomonadaceae bacterium]|nr:MAG: putative hydroxylaminobenzene mutase [Caulobacteraceae bacterium]MBT9445693.1 hydrogenase [Hyphomonadaceae bacterium]TPW08340.1 MAG: putative hydroxylaminobenzene mutase [Alphaproteobacteria bacterium]
MPEVLGRGVFGVASPDRTLIRAGIALFLLGLLTGFATPLLPAPRLGLASHLEGVMNGLFLVALGLIWGRLTLARWAGSLTFYAALYGTFANWLATLLSAVWGAAGMMPMAGHGAVGSPAAELIVAALLISLSVAMVLVCVLTLWGLRKVKAV